MADFRRHALAFASLACFLGLTSTARAQFGPCNASAASPIDERAEGITEQAGDFVVTCTGGVVTAPGALVPQVNITISANTQITSRVLSGGPPPAPATVEATLLINEPAPFTQNYCATSTTGVLGCATGAGTSFVGTGFGGGAISTLPPGTPTQYTGTKANAFGGVAVGLNQVTFFGVPIDPPGPTVTATLAGVTTSYTPVLTIRVTDVRLNASSLGAPTGFSVTSSFLSISASGGLSVNNPTQTVGSVRRGLVGVAVNNLSAFGKSLTGTPLPYSLTVGTGAAPTLQQCTNQTLTSAVGGAGAVEVVSFTEGFGSATKLKGGAVTNLGTSTNTESQTVFAGTGFPTSTTGTSVLGVADFATRVKVTFNNLQAGVTVYVPVSIGGYTISGPTGTLIPSSSMQLTASEAGPFAPVAAASVTSLAAGFVQLATTANANGTQSGVAVYEVTTQIASAPNAVETFYVPVIATWTASPSTNSPSLGTSTVNVDFAPTSTVTTYLSGVPIPRFVPSSTAINGFAINSCATNLLFPFVTNIAGFDTGLAISDTSTDPFGTAAQNGTCTLNFYGSNAPSAFTTPNINSGTVYTTLASTVAAGFQGYMIAVCKFQYAHGFAFVTDGFGGPGRGLSQGYLPLVIPDPAVLGGRAANPIGLLTPGTGEQITN